MSSFPQKRKVNVAVSGKRSHDLSHAHITTIDFGRLKAIENRYMVPGDEFRANVRSVMQVLSQLPSPTFGSFDVTFRSFFVPIHNIWDKFYDFIKNQQSVVNGSLSSIDGVPYCTVKDFSNFFYKAAYSTNVSGTPSVNEYDFYVPTASQYRKLTRLGRLCYDFCTSNRLNIPLGSNSEEKINVLPLIAFWKFYFDWIVPSRFIHNHEDYIQLLIDKINNGNLHVSVDDLEKFLLKEPLCYFMDDIFTTATEDAFGSNQNEMVSPYVINNPLNNYGDVPNEQQVVAGNVGDEYDTNGASAVLTGDGDNTSFVFNMFTLQTLGKLQDLLNRNMIAGTKVQDWLLTEFGMRPSTDALHLSSYLGSHSNQMAITDILSMADTAAQGGVGLGSYGGKLKERYDFDFSYKAKEHGYFFITFELIPRTSYYQGKEPEYNMLNRFDFFQPEFDNQQGSPLSFGDLFFDGKYNEQYHSPSSPWGFSLQYSRLKFATDIVSGDFRNRFGNSLKSWFLARDMRKIALTSSGIDFIDEEFCLVKSKYQDWNYIFTDTNDELDHFVAMFYFQMPCLRPMKSITEGFEPTYKNGGKDVDVNFSGSIQ